MVCGIHAASQDEVALGRMDVHREHTGLVMRERPQQVTRETVDHSYRPIRAARYDDVVRRVGSHCQNVARVDRRVRALEPIGDLRVARS